MGIFRFKTLWIFAIMIVPLTLFMGYCNNCIKGCIVFTDMSADECINDCRFCENVDNRFNNWLNWWHIDDYSYKLSDDPKCTNNYAPPPVLETKSDKSSFSKPPNIILFVLDDLDEMISPYFEAMTFSKELFKLNGTHFENGYTSSSFCCPARCQIFTGMYGHNNGVISSFGSFASVNAFRKPLHLNGTRKMLNNKCVNNENRTISVLLKKYGNYKTAMFGKYLNGFENDWLHNIPYVPPGWDRFDICANNYQYIGNLYVMTNWDSQNKTLKYVFHGRDEKDYLTDVISQKSVDFIDTHRSKGESDPLFMYVAPTAPHFPQTYAKRHKDKLAYWDTQFNKYVESRPNYHNDESLKTKSSWIKKNSKERDGLLSAKTSTWHGKQQFNIHRMEFRKRMVTLYSVDEMIERVYNKIKELGELDNTVFVLTSDNGFNMGSHKLYHKMSPNDESVRVPFYMSGKGIKRGFTDSRLVLLNDLTPTFLSLAGFKQTEQMDGLDLTTDEYRNNILLEYGKGLSDKQEFYTGKLDRATEFKMIIAMAPEALAQDVQPYIAIRNKDYMFVNYYVNDYFDATSEYELYDMNIDPYQLKNVYGDANYSNVVLELKEKLSRLSQCSTKQECVK